MSGIIIMGTSMRTPCFRERQSSKLRQDFRRERGFSIRANLAGEETAFIAEYSASGLVITALGEFDTLSGLTQKADQPRKESCCRSPVCPA